jgi:hypothetical protein
MKVTRASGVGFHVKFSPSFCGIDGECVNAALSTPPSPEALAVQ